MLHEAGDPVDWLAPTGSSTRLPRAVGIVAHPDHDTIGAGATREGRRGAGPQIAYSR